MSLFAKIFGGGKGHHYSEGLALFEADRFAEAIERLRLASDGDGRSPDSSLASFYLRLALVAEGRRLLKADRAPEAVLFLAEAADNSATFPDLQFLLGTAQGLGGGWDEAYRAARRSRRLNPHYIEARLLEYCALLRLERWSEAEDRLRELEAEGRWQDHWILSDLTKEGDTAARLTETEISAILLRAVAGPQRPQDVASAVALCRAGDWEGGLRQFATLIEEHPDYPDYRVKHAAALYQLGRLQEARTEVEAALALNPSYRAAIYLKSLLLAEEGRIEAAWSFISGQLDQISPATTGTHEDLFGAYLEAVLALLTGRTTYAPQLLGDWGDLVQGFARAVLVEAAAADLRGHRDGCRRRLEKLVSSWPAEAEYRYLLTAHHIDCGRHEAAQALLAEWPAAPDGQEDRRPLYLQALLELERDRLPDLPASTDDAKPVSVQEATLLGSLPTAGAVDSWPAWQFLAARADLLRQDASACWLRCQHLGEQGFLSETLTALQLDAAVTLATQTVDEADSVAEAALAAVRQDAGGWQPPRVRPRSLLAGWAALEHRAERSKEAEVQLAMIRGIHPEQLNSYWLSAPFWLEPVRRRLA